MSAIAQRVNLATRRVPPWVLYVLAPIPAVWWFYQGLTGGLGAEPINALERLYGEFALQLLILGLAITPLRTHFNVDLVRFRRAIGVISFFYVFAHLLVWLVLDIGILSQIWTDILKRPYITIGMVGFLMLVPLALTSNNLSIRKLGPIQWRKLHKLTYGAVLLGALHGFMVAKGIQWEPMIYIAIVVILLLARAIPRRRRVAARA
ncbi:MAG: protein-methionine-sulfoxide reductase heme-binding subunit MsrQ [Pseudomonadota bacterium]